MLGPIHDNWQPAKGKRPSAGVMVLSVTKDSPMLKQGITSGSVIVSIAGRPVAAISDLQSVINDTPAEKCSIQLADGPRNALASVPLTGN